MDERKAIMQDSSPIEVLNSAYEPGCAAAWLAEHIGELNTFSGSKNMTDDQVKALARMISVEYADMKISEILLFFYRFKCGYFGKFYGKVDPMVITCALKDFKTEIYARKQYYVNLEYEENEARIKQQQEEKQQRWNDCQKALCNAATSEAMRKVFQNIIFEDLYENDTILMLKVFPEEYSLIEQQYLSIFSSVLRHFYPNTILKYRMREVKPSMEDKEQEKRQKQNEEILASARHLISNEQGWGKNIIEQAKNGFKLKYKLSPEDYIAKFGG